MKSGWWSIGSIAFLAGHVAIAQQAPIVPDWPQTRLEQRDPTTRALYIMATCVVYRYPDAARVLLATTPRSLGEVAAINAAVPRESEFRMGTDRLTIRRHDIIRGALAEALYNGRRTRPRSDDALPVGEPVQSGGTDRSIEIGRQVAHCAVHRTPCRAHAVISWNAGSAREREALLALRDTFATCLPAGERLTVSRLMMRTLLAEQLFHAARRFRTSFVNP